MGWPAKKNTAFTLIFPIFDKNGDLVSGAAGLDSEISKDGGAFTDCTNEATEIGQGIYTLALTASEMNADRIVIITKTTTADAKTAVNIIYTDSGQIGEIKAKTDGLPPDPADQSDLESEIRNPPHVG